MSNSKKGFKRLMAMAYGIGGAIVILGALFKLMHWPGSSEMLIIGLGTEALIFVISAFEPLPKEELDWALVYPELAGGEKLDEPEDEQGLLSQKIDEMLKKSNLDAKTVSGFSESINNFSSAAKSINVAATSISDINKINSSFAEKSKELATQMDGLSKNISSLNSVYGGVLTAMTGSKNQ